MTRSTLNRTLRATYLVLGLIIAISIAAKFADWVPGIAGTPVERLAGAIYEYLRDMALVLVTVVAAYLASVFHKRSQFLERLEEEWRGIVRTKSALYMFCEKPNPTADDYLSAFCRISETLDNMRVVYANVGETEELIGLYPFAPLHDMRRALQSIDPRKRSDVTPEERKLVRDAILQAFYALRETFLEELDLGEPDSPLTAAVARRLKRPGAAEQGQRLQARQIKTYESHAAARRGDIEVLLRRLYAEEQQR
jgi:hypothetical protein